MPAPRFTDDQVRRIRAEYVADETLTAADLARKYDVHGVTMQYLLSGVSYARVPGATPLRHPTGGGRPRRWTDAQLRQLQEMIDAGYGEREIAEILGCSTSHVYYVRTGGYNYQKA